MKPEAMVQFSVPLRIIHKVKGNLESNPGNKPIHTLWTIMHVFEHSEETEVPRGRTCKLPTYRVEVGIEPPSPEVQGKPANC